MHIGILKTDDVRPNLREQYGEYHDMFIALLRAGEPSLRFTIFDVQRGEYPASPSDFDALLMTGSKAGVYEDIDWVHRLTEYVGELRHSGTRLVGICFGHQMIAHALGGKVEKSPKGWGVGRHCYTLAGTAGAYGEPGSEFCILASHQDQVVEPAEGAVVLASSDFCPIAMTQVGDFALTFQGHPEFCPGYARSLLEIRQACIGELNYHNGMASLGQSLDQSLVAGWMIDFMRG